MKCYFPGMHFIDLNYHVNFGPHIIHDFKNNMIITYDVTK